MGRQYYVVPKSVKPMVVACLFLLWLAIFRHSVILYLLFLKDFIASALSLRTTQKAPQICSTRTHLFLTG